jgi:hypothetical protein
MRAAGAVAVAAQITPPGAFYAADVPTKSGVHAFVTYVPMRDVLPKLR